MATRAGCQDVLTQVEYSFHVPVARSHKRCLAGIDQGTGGLRPSMGYVRDRSITAEGRGTLRNFASLETHKLIAASLFFKLRDGTMVVPGRVRRNPL